MLPIIYSHGYSTSKRSLDCFPLIFSFNMVICSYDIVEFVTFFLAVFCFFAGYITTGKHMHIDDIVLIYQAEGGNIFNTE